MTSSFASMKMVVLALVLIALINPTFSSDDDDNYKPPIPSPQVDKLGFRICPKMSKDKIVERIVEHVNASKTVKVVLKGSAVFVDCAAGKFCGCFKLRLEPLIAGCFGAVGGLCMKRAIIGPKTTLLANCNLSCVSSHMVNVTNNNNQPLDDKAISDLCYGKCAKKMGR